MRHLLDYAATNPDTIITYHASAMVLTGNSDASYLSEAKSRRREGGHFFMTDDTAEIPNNGAVTTISRIIKAVMSSASKAELCALFFNCRKSVPEKTTLEEMGYKQPPMTMKMYNTTALGVFNNNIVSKKLKSMEMRINWLRCR